MGPQGSVGGFFRIITDFEGEDGERSESGYLIGWIYGVTYETATTEKLQTHRTGYLFDVPIQAARSGVYKRRVRVRA